MASAHTLPLALDKCLRAGFFNVDDPGSAGTISIDRGKGIEVICVVVTAGAETRTLPDTTSLPVNQRILIVFKTDGGDLTITGNAGDDVVLTNAGEIAEFVVSDNNGTKEWQRTISSVAASGSSFDANGGVDAFILDTDGDTTLSAPTDDQIDVEIAGADDFTFTANSFNVLTGSAIDLADSCQVKFGTGDDITMAWDGTDFDVLQATANSSIKWGISGAGIDQVWYGDTVGANLTWDQSADTLLLGDGAKIGFGSATAGDIIIGWDGTDLDVTQATANSSIKWGVDGAGIDQVWYGDTASNSMTWDQSEDDLIFTVAAGIVGATGIVPFIPDAQQEDAPAPGAISVATFLTTITTEGAEAFSLANGAQKGQIKKIVLTVTAGDATLTITTPADENTVVFSVVGDTVELLWNGAAWRILAAYNQATGAITTPVLSTV